MIASGESMYLFGIYDRGGEALMASAGRRGWVLIQEVVGHDPQDTAASSYEDLSGQGFGVIVQLEHGCHGAGTLPHSALYEDFAARCASFVRNSPGCHIWVIGNHPNAAEARPGHSSPQEEVITPHLYARCYKRCREAIRSQPYHQDDIVLLAATAPFCTDTTYPGNRRGDWVRYQQDVILLLGPGNYDGVTIHAYTHGYDPARIASEQRMGPPFSDRHAEFKTYQDSMAIIPPRVPVFITDARPLPDEASGATGWPDGGAPSKWVQAAYEEIDRWNQQYPERQIRSLILYRWDGPQDEAEQWSIQHHPAVIEDFCRALANNYRWHLPARPEYRAVFLTQNTPAKMVAGETIYVPTRLRNEGSRTWLHDGSNPFCLASRWYDEDNREVLVPVAYHNHLPRDVSSGEEVELLARVMSPVTAGRYRLRWEMVHEGVTWFGRQGDPGQTASVEVLPAPPPRKPPIEEIMETLAQHPTRRYARRTREAIKSLVIHHSVVPPSVDARQIARYHVEQQGWPGIGYHFFITPEGHIQQTQPLEVISYHAGTVGNQEGVGICLSGNFTDQPPTEPQLNATAQLLAWLLSALNLPLEAVHGHCDYRNTQCPGLTWTTIWRDRLLKATERILESAHPPEPTSKVLYHYLLFWQTDDQWAVEEWRAAERYIGQFRVTAGFSVDDAMYAEYVTLVGGSNRIPREVEARLRAAGSKVERIPGETPIQIKAILDEMAARRQRFLTLE
ncbi:MAG: N-acetylmuramoyl-L-alanine amidase [Anaerolineae bacterium]